MTKEDLVEVLAECFIAGSAFATKKNFQYELEDLDTAAVEHACCVLLEMIEKYG
jgi:hypothetical protein